ncbi:MAG: NUDIX hydrolase [Bacillota bacterium]
MAIKEKLHEETLSTSYLYRGIIINVRQDQVKTKGEKTAFREVVEHPGAVAILAFNNQSEIILVRQHRQPAGEVMLEIPAGKIDPGEDPLQCARREMLEETGLEAASWIDLYTYYSSPGFCDEKIYLYLAENMRETASSTGDVEENLRIETISLPEAKKQIENGGIKDGKTIIAIQYALIKNSIN